jgi:hypothetical protein
MRSPVSELGTNSALRTVRSVELQGESKISTVSELGAGETEGSAPVELGGESAPRVVRGGSVDGDIVGQGSVKKDGGAGVATNF